MSISRILTYDLFRKKIRKWLRESLSFFSYSYSCRDNRKIIPRKMLSAANDSNVTDSVTVTCSGQTARFEPSLEDLTCTGGSN